MLLNWKNLCGEQGFEIEGSKVKVSLERGRQQVVEVTASDEHIYLFSIVARPAAVAQFENAALRSWQRNRALSLVAFRVDDKGRLVGESWVPTLGLAREEFQLYIKTVATECDRFEFQITGKDSE